MAEINDTDITGTAQVRQRYQDGRKIDIVGPNGEQQKVDVADLTQADSELATTFSYPLYAGGSSAVVWCWFISGAGCMCIAVSTGTPKKLWTVLTD